MDNFALYHNLSAIKEIIEKYACAESFRRGIDNALDRLSKRTYRVAVVGEFKRGKSSLINALLGTEILPTDILPATAVTNRIIHDTEQKIEIEYKDGTREEAAPEELINFATKLDAEKEKIAARIREIVVHYPSVLGSNNIQLIDTPGLNDDERMTKATFDVFDKIDTAIVVISATMPLSLTEQKLICNLIECRNIFNLTFVVTFIDRVSDEPEEQDRVIELIARRIREDTYEMFRSRNGSDPELLAKAEEILAKPDVFAVSSKLAMQGFIRGNRAMIEESRFDRFKLSLMTILTANQEIDTKKYIIELAKDIRAAIPELEKAEQERFTEEIREKEARLEALISCARERQSAIARDFSELSASLGESGFFQAASGHDYFIKKAEPKKYLIAKLSEIKREEYTTERVKQAIYDATEEAGKAFLPLYSEIREKTERLMDRVIEKAEERNRLCEVTCEISKDEVPFPEYYIDVQKVVSQIKNFTGNVMPEAAGELEKAFAAGHMRVKDYILAQYACITKKEKSVSEKIRANITKMRSEIESGKAAIAEGEPVGAKKFSEVQEILEGIICG